MYTDRCILISINNETRGTGMNKTRYAVIDASTGITGSIFDDKREAEEKAKFMASYHERNFYVREVTE